MLIFFFLPRKIVEFHVVDIFAIVCVCVFFFLEVKLIMRFLFYLFYNSHRFSCKVHRITSARKLETRKVGQSIRDCSAGNGFIEL